MTNPRCPHCKGTLAMSVVWAISKTHSITTNQHGEPMRGDRVLRTYPMSHADGEDHVVCLKCDTDFGTGWPVVNQGGDGR